MAAFVVDEFYSLSYIAQNAIFCPLFRFCFILAIFHSVKRQAFTRRDSVTARDSKCDRPLHRCSHIIRTSSMPHK
jgi:hypothetical protein